MKAAYLVSTGSPDLIRPGELLTPTVRAFGPGEAEPHRARASSALMAFTSR